jgi:hypothetical protein
VRTPPAPCHYALLAFAQTRTDVRAKAKFFLTTYPPSLNPSLRPMSLWPIGKGPARPKEQVELSSLAVKPEAVLPEKGDSLVACFEATPRLGAKSLVQASHG